LRDVPQTDELVAQPNLIALNRVRTIFQRMSDARFFNGWILHLSPHKVIAHTQSNCLAMPGDDFSFQVFGNKQEALFQARLMTLHRAETRFDPTGGVTGNRNGLELACQLTTKIQLQACKEQPRFFVEGVIADIAAPGNELIKGVTVIDVGPGGFAAVTGRGLAKGEHVAVTILGKGLHLQCIAEVRNCIVCGGNQDYQRTGMKILEMDRINALRWKQLYTSIVESNRTSWAVGTAEVRSVVKLKQKKAS
jgi:hypothetical protein